MHPAYVPPPPPPTVDTGIMHPALTGDEGEIKSEESTIDLATEITLLLIQNMLAQF
jgi:hypothetical protein